MRRNAVGTAKNFEVSYRNPATAEWSYGIKIAEAKHTMNLTYHGFAFVVTKSGEWQIQLDPEFDGYLATSITNSGYFDRHQVPFNCALAAPQDRCYSRASRSSVPLLESPQTGCPGHHPAVVVPLVCF